MCHWFYSSVVYTMLDRVISPSNRSSLRVGRVEEKLHTFLTVVLDGGE